MEPAAIFDATWGAFLGRFFLNLIVVVIISRFFYYPKGKGDKEYLFTYITTSIVIFLVCILVARVKVELGVALGLFAIFSVIRFRSTQATPRELSYLFLCLGISLINALLPLDTPFIRLLVNLILVLAVIYIADYFIFKNRVVEKMITYDRLDLLEEGKRDELEADLRIRFGITDVVKIQVGNIDTLKGRVKLKVRIRDKEDTNFLEK
jgi:hypothetical protein